MVELASEERSESVDDGDPNDVVRLLQPFGKLVPAGDHWPRIVESSIEHMAAGVGDQPRQVSAIGGEARPDRQLRTKSPVLLTDQLPRITSR
jgi:hypothetical protein